MAESNNNCMFHRNDPTFLNRIDTFHISQLKTFQYMDIFITKKCELIFKKYDRKLSYFTFGLTDHLTQPYVVIKGIKTANNFEKVKQIRKTCELFNIRVYNNMIENSV